MTLPVLSLLRDVTERQLFVIHHGNQADWVDAVFAKLMTSLHATSHADFRFATVDSILTTHPGFSVEQVRTDNSVLCSSLQRIEQVQTDNSVLCNSLQRRTGTDRQQSVTILAPLGPGGKP